MFSYWSTEQCTDHNTNDMTECWELTICSSNSASGNPNLIMFLVANKVDLEDKRKVGNEVIHYLNNFHLYIYIYIGGTTFYTLNEFVQIVFVLV